MTINFRKKTYEIFFRVMIARCAIITSRASLEISMKSMGKVGRGDERRYLGVGLDGFGGRWVDHEDGGGYAVVL